jgi:hypothetical protein
MTTIRSTAPQVHLKDNTGGITPVIDSFPHTNYSPLAGSNQLEQVSYIGFAGQNYH